MCSTEAQNLLPLNFGSAPDECADVLEATKTSMGATAHAMKIAHSNETKSPQQVQTRAHAVGIVGHIDLSTRWSGRPTPF